MSEEHIADVTEPGQAEALDIKGLGRVMFVFLQPPSPQAIVEADKALALRPMEPQERMRQVYQLLTDYEAEPDWQNIDQDPVIRESLNLPLPLLLSLYQNNRMQPIIAYVLSKRPDVPETEKGKLEGLDFIANLTQKPKDQWREYERAQSQLINSGRKELLYLTADKLCRGNGLDLEADFLSPIKLAEMKLGYDPHMGTLESRAASTRIPFALRSLVGRLRFARQAIAQGSINSALIQEFQYIFTTHTHFMNIVRLELEKKFPIKVSVTNEGLVLEEGEIDETAAKEFWDTNEIVQAMLRIAEADYGARTIFHKPVAKFSDIGHHAYHLAIAMVDPAISEALVDCPMIETAVIHALHIPERKLYRYNQHLLLLRGLARMTL